MHRIQERLKTRRNRLGWSQEALALKAEVAERLISSIESGEVFKKDVGLSLSSIEKLASALGVNPLWLLGSDRMDGNELLVEDSGPDYTAEAVQKLTDAGVLIDEAKRLMVPGRGSHRPSGARHFSLNEDTSSASASASTNLLKKGAASVKNPGSK